MDSETKNLQARFARDKPSNVVAGLGQGLVVSAPNTSIHRFMEPTHSCLTE